MGLDWVLLAVVWLVGPLFLTWRYVHTALARTAIAAIVITYTIVMWIVIGQSDSSTAAIGYGTMAPLAYVAPVGALFVNRLRLRRT